MQIEEGKKSVTSETRGKQTERGKSISSPSVYPEANASEQVRGKKSAGARAKHFQFF